jgi:hypothetical protein
VKIEKSKSFEFPKSSSEDPPPNTIDSLQQKLSEVKLTSNRVGVEGFQVNFLKLFCWFLLEATAEIFVRSLLFC